MRRLGITSTVLGIGIAAVAILGPLVLDVIRYHVIDDVLNQIEGGDLVGLVLVAPAAIAAGVLCLRGHRAGPVLALGASAYAVYTAIQLSIGEFATQPGNSERFFPLFLALILLGGATFVQAWQATDAEVLPVLRGALRTTVVWVSVGVAAFLTIGLHLPGLVDVLGGAPYELEYTQSPTVFWVVKLMDLGIVVPVALVTAVALRRRAVWADRLAYVMVTWGAMLGSAVASMGVMMVVRDDPTATVGVAAGFVVFALAFLALAVSLFRPLFARSGADERRRSSAGGARRPGGLRPTA